MKKQYLLLNYAYLAVVFKRNAKTCLIWEKRSISSGWSRTWRAAAWAGTAAGCAHNSTRTKTTFRRQCERNAASSRRDFDSRETTAIRVFLAWVEARQESLPSVEKEYQICSVSAVGRECRKRQEAVLEWECRACPETAAAGRKCVACTGSAVGWECRACPRAAAAGRKCGACTGSAVELECRACPRAAVGRECRALAVGLEDCAWSVSACPAPAGLV
jgi:hypothetical protein